MAALVDPDYGLNCPCPLQVERRLSLVPPLEWDARAQMEPHPRLRPRFPEMLSVANRSYHQRVQCVPGERLGSVASVPVSGS